MNCREYGDTEGRRQKLMQVSLLLYEAYRTGMTIEPEQVPTDLSEADAYQVQDDLVGLKIAKSAEKVAGYKISLTSRVTQEMAGSDGPAYGTLTDRNLHLSPAVLRLSELNEPLVEGEVLFAVTKSLSGLPTDAEILANTRLSVAIEVPTSRCKRWFPIGNLHGFIGDCAGSGAVVVGDQFAVPDGDSLESIAMVMRWDGRVVAEGTGRDVLGSPLNAIRWLVSKLGLVGRGLNPGDVVSSGTFVTPMPARVGTFTADVSNLGQASVVFAPRSLATNGRSGRRRTGGAGDRGT